MLNPRLDRHAIARQFRKDKRVVIRNFLTNKAASMALRGLDDLTRRKAWNENSLGNLRSTDDSFCCLYDKYPLKNIPPKPGELSKPNQKIKANHSLACVAEFLNSVPCHKFIERVTGESLTHEMAYVAASRYLGTHFCGSHDDHIPPRKIAFILHLTKKWLVHWGGQFVVLDSSATRIVEATSPSFNTMVLFKVPLQHAVLPVSSFSQYPRYSVSGWYCGE